ncbi:MAG: flagellar biosynthesis protein FlaG [Clostridiales bacterium]|nr:flagellar biosynthesis protein FlaG [Clostridiales bacterium]
MEINKISEVSKNNIEKKPVLEEIKKKNTNDSKEKHVNAKDLDSAVDKANNVLFKNNTHLQFRIHEKTNEVMVKIVDDVSGEVLKEIPPEKMLDLVAKLWEIAGIIVDEKA